MLEFNTDEDLYTVMQYKRQESRRKGLGDIVSIDIDKLAELHEEDSKILTWILITNMGLPYNHD
tara:strand:+ start:62 stop:253 length:192 start_codon:yes stop_codon:yes gene_type:complete